MTSVKVILAETVDKVTGEAEIADMWQRHYSELLNSNKDTSHKHSVQADLQCIKVLGEHSVTAVEVFEAIKDLKLNKSSGLDCLQAEHFRYADMNTLSCLLAMLLNSMLCHGFIPDKAMFSVIIPVLKNKKGLLTDKNNYRPVALTSVFSKIIESVILDKFVQKLQSSDYQFGFKKKHGSDMAIFSLKQVIEYYNLRSSPVYVCFLDASKAFDRLNYWILFRKLLDRGIPNIFIRFFCYWYFHQQLCVKWGCSQSEKFTTVNGVRQGGIISPMFFNVYMNDLSDKLKNADAGCCFNGYSMNHLFYADDS